MKVLKGILTVAAFSLFLVACGEKKAEEAVEAAPVEEVTPVVEEAPVVTLLLLLHQLLKKLNNN